MFLMGIFWYHLYDMSNYKLCNLDTYNHNFGSSVELNSWRNGTTLEWERLLLCAAISFLLIGLMIAIGIGIPARRAMKVQPAEALHDE